MNEQQHRRIDALSEDWITELIGLIDHDGSCGGVTPERLSMLVARNMVGIAARIDNLTEAVESCVKVIEELARELHRINTQVSCTNRPPAAALLSNHEQR